MKKCWFRAMAGILLAPWLLAACGVQNPSPSGIPSAGATASASSLSAASMPPAVSLESADPAAESPEELPADLLPDLDDKALEDTMPEADYETFTAYLPVLRGEETFRWVAGPYDGYPDYDWEPFDADMAAVRDRLWSEYITDGRELPETLTLDRLAVQDIDGDGTAELVLLFQDGAYNYLVLHREGDAVYGTSFYVRWFEGLQKNGVYWGSGGAGDSTYYRMAFQNGRFEQEELAHRVEWANGCTCTLGGETVPESVFEAWYAENMPGDVTWYAPDGSVIPENQ